MIAGSLFLIVLLIALNGFFVGVLFAAPAFRRGRGELPGDQNKSAAPDPARLIAAAQLGITLASLSLGVVAASTFERLLGPYLRDAALTARPAFVRGILPAVPLAAALVLVGGLHAALGALAPRASALQSPERFARFAAPLMRAFDVVFGWFAGAVSWIARAALSLVGAEYTSANDPAYSAEEARPAAALPEPASADPAVPGEIAQRKFDFGDMLVRQVSIPRTEVKAVEAGALAGEALAQALECGLTKMPVFEGSLDQITGIVHLRDLIAATQADGGSAQTARDLAREVLFVPEAGLVNDLLHQFRARRTHIAIVLDEFGGTSGLVTLEDLLEEIVGDVRDPFETAPPPIQLLPNGSALIDGLTLIEEINERFGLSIVDPYYDTIAGYILSKLGRIPQAGDSAEDPENGIRLKVEKMDRLRIAQVLLVRL